MAIIGNIPYFQTNPDLSGPNGWGSFVKHTVKPSIFGGRGWGSMIFDIHFNHIKLSCQIFLRSASNISCERWISTCVCRRSAVCQLVKISRILCILAQCCKNFRSLPDALGIIQKGFLGKTINGTSQELGTTPYCGLTWSRESRDYLMITPSSMPTHPGNSYQTVTFGIAPSRRWSTKRMPCCSMYCSLS